MGMRQQGADPVARMQERVGEASEFVKTLGNPNRMMIACALVDGEKSVGELETMLGFHQPALSQQIAGLRDAGFITGRREAKQVFYRLSDPRVIAFISLMHDLFCRDDDDTARAAAVAAGSLRHTVDAETTPAAKPSENS